jgi:hypothetical protein
MFESVLGLIILVISALLVSIVIKNIFLDEENDR